MGGFFSASCSDASSLLTHSLCGTASNCNPHLFNAGKKSAFHLTLFEFSTWKTLNPCPSTSSLAPSPTANSTTALAVTSTGNHPTSSSPPSTTGNAPTVNAARTVVGTASLAFHMPCTVSPHTCPTRTTLTLAPTTLFAAASQIRSATHLLCAYPMGSTACHGTSVSGMAWLGVPRSAAAMLEMKVTRGFGDKGEVAARESKACVERRACGSKLRSAWLKLTGQALWIMCVVVARIAERVVAGRPRVGEERSQGWAEILERWVVEDRWARSLACWREVRMRLWAVGLSGARTGQ